MLGSEKAPELLGGPRGVGMYPTGFWANDLQVIGL